MADKKIKIQFEIDLHDLVEKQFHITLSDNQVKEIYQALIKEGPSLLALIIMNYADKIGLH